MKLIVSNGKTLEVRDVGEPIMTVVADKIPVKYNGTQILHEDKARAIVRELIDCGLYEIRYSK